MTGTALRAPGSVSVREADRNDHWSLLPDSLNDMVEKPLQSSMVCPCCGQLREISSPECASCGARQVGEPLAPPDVLLPKLGPAFAARACALVVIGTFLVFWIFGNDLKVGRALLVYVLGDGTRLTKSL